MLALTLLALANDCDDCFDIPNYDGCWEGLQATEVAPGEVRLLIVLTSRNRSHWTLTRNDTVLFEDATFAVDQAVASDYAHSGSCYSSHLGLAFRLVNRGLSDGEYTYVLSNERDEFEDTVIVGNPGCGCASVRPEGLLIGVLMLGAGALLSRRRGDTRSG